MKVFVEVEIGVTPYLTQFLANNTQAKRKIIWYETPRHKHNTCRYWRQNLNHSN